MEIVFLEQPLRFRMATNENISATYIELLQKLIAISSFSKEEEKAAEF